MNRNMRRKKKKKKSRGWLIAGLIILLSVFICLCLYVYFFKDLNTKEFPTDNSDLGITEQNDEITKSTLGNDSIVNIALFGVDQRDGDEDSRSDAIIVLSVDKQKGQIKLSSIMRDSLVNIERYGQGKINRAYYLGGPQLAVKTLNENFKLNIKEYITVDFSQMAQVIDAVGGVDIDITESEVMDANISIEEQAMVAGLPEDYIKSAGLQTLNGTQAVAYARIRNVGNSDFQRTSRQREVLRKVLNKAVNMDPIKYPAFAKKFLPIVETSLNLGDIISLAEVLPKKPALEDVRFPTNDDLIGDGSIIVDGEDCVYFDVESATEKLHKFIYDDIDPTTEADRDSNGQ